MAIRGRAIQCLEKLFRLSSNDEERRAVVQTLSEATRTPQRGNYADGLLQVVLSNTLDIVRFYAPQTSSLSFELEVFYPQAPCEPQTGHCWFSGVNRGVKFLPQDLKNWVSAVF